MRSAHDVTYIATAVVGDDEMRVRVRQHRADRPAAWRTIESSAHVGLAVLQAETPTVILDCITMLAAQAMEGAHPRDGEAATRAVTAEVDGLLQALQARSGVLFAVTNEVGLSVHPPTNLGRWFQDALGHANQRLAAAADEVVLLVCGLPVQLKPSGETR